MSDTVFKVPYTTILDIQLHPNAERLEIATVYGFQVIIPKGRYKVGDKAIYVPVDSILSESLEAEIFPPDSKVKLKDRRIRQIKLRGLASQGMLIDPSELTAACALKEVIPEIEDDLQHALGISKYEPPAKTVLQSTRGKPKKDNEHPLFHKYKGLDNIKWMPNKFKEGDLVVIQEKLHGTNARASVLPFVANTWLKKIKKILRLAPQFENCYGSNNVELSSKMDRNGFYGEDIYGKVFKQMDIFSKIKVGEIVFGEIVGPGIQKGYSYGLKEPIFVLFDVKMLQPNGCFLWLKPSDVKEFAAERGLQCVPVLYTGSYIRDTTYALTKGPSIFGPEKVREGVVIKMAENYSVNGDKQALKWVSEDYLADDSNTDDH